MRWILLATISLAACNKGESTGPDTGPTLDTGWFRDTSVPDTDHCAAAVQSTIPAADAVDVYWRSALQVRTATADLDAYDTKLLDAFGRELDVTAEPTAIPQGYRLLPSEPLEPISDYTLSITACGIETRVPFTTTAYGLPLAGGPSDLIGNAYSFDLTSATWVQPPGFGTLLSLYFDAPVLAGVQWADGSSVDLIGAQGFVGDDGVEQAYAPTWEFPLAGFDDKPFFVATADSVTITATAIDLQVHDFQLEGTFAADGSSIGGARISGLGDTRNLGPAFELGDDPGAVCEIAAGMGAICEACPDGEPWCLALEATELDGDMVPGLHIIQIAPDP